jgi:phospholipid transport system substrate-binding protein
LKVSPVIAYSPTAIQLHARDLRHPRLLGVLALIGLALICASPRASAAATAPAQLVQSNSQRVVHALSERRAEFQSDPAALHSFIRQEFAQLFDRVYAARLVLGLDGRTASDTDMRAFADALGDNLMNRYGNSLLKVDPGLNVKITSETPLRNGTIVKVTSLIDRRNGTPVQVDYLFHQNAGRWQVFDVSIEGISFVQTFHTMFAGDLRTKSLSRITEELRNDKIQVTTGANFRSSGEQ